MDNRDNYFLLDYFQTKLNQAQRDVDLFSLMIQEVEKLLKDKQSVQQENKFLHIVSNLNKQ